MALRRPVALESEEIQQRLFTFKKYTYHRALATNLTLTPAAVWRFYCDRGTQELLLREIKDSYALSKIPTRSFWATPLTWKPSCGRTIWRWPFQQLLSAPDVQQWNISTLRREWWLPAEWVKRGNRNLLVLPVKYPRQDLFARIQRAAIRVRPLI